MTQQERKAIREMIQHQVKRRIAQQFSIMVMRSFAQTQRHA